MKRNWSKEEIRQQIEGMDAWIPVSKIEERLGMPPTTLQKVLAGKRELPKKWVSVLESYFIEQSEEKADEKLKEEVANDPEITEILEEIAAIEPPKLSRFQELLKQADEELKSKK